MKPVCVKCGRFYRAKRNGFRFVETGAPAHVAGAPMTIRSGGVVATETAARAMYLWDHPTLYSEDGCPVAVVRRIDFYSDPIDVTTCDDVTRSYIQGPARLRLDVESIL